MADERVLHLTPNSFEPAYDAINHRVILLLDVSHPEFGLAPGLSVALSFSPAEARLMSQVLLRKADEVEAGLPRA